MSRVMARMKLFSQRRKLFSEEYNEGGMTLRQVVCRDCGHVMETAENVSQILCPNCGGRRFNLKLFKEKLNPETEKHEDSLNEFETKLKRPSVIRQMICLRRALLVLLIMM